MEFLGACFWCWLATVLHPPSRPFFYAPFKACGKCYRFYALKKADKASDITLSEKTEPKSERAKTRATVIR